MSLDASLQSFQGSLGEEELSAVFVATPRGIQRVTLNEKAYELLSKGAEQLGASSPQEIQDKIREAVEPWIAQIEDEHRDKVTNAVVPPPPVTPDPIPACEEVAPLILPPITTTQEKTDSSSTTKENNTFTVQVPSAQAPQFASFFALALQSFFGSAATKDEVKDNTDGTAKKGGDPQDTDSETDVDGSDSPEEEVKETEKRVERMRIVPREWLEALSNLPDPDEPISVSELHCCGFWSVDDSKGDSNPNASRRSLQTFRPPASYS